MGAERKIVQLRCFFLEKRHGPGFLPGKTQTMVRVNCQKGDGGGSWVGQESQKASQSVIKHRVTLYNKL